MQTETPQEAARRLAASALRDGNQAVALHEYQDAQGQPVFWRIRCKHPEGGKWIRPLHRDGKNWRIGEPSFPATGKPLYRLPELLAQPEVEVWIVEGETCADALLRCGVLATTSGSADSAGSADWQPLAGRTVIVWPDNDDAGQRYADAVTDKLRALGCVVKQIDPALLGLPEKGDVVDWLQGHPEATSIDLCSLPLVSGPISVPTVSSLPHVVLTTGQQIQPMAVDWIWEGWLAAGKLHLIGGQPGTGKTTIALALAATVTIGGRWPDGTRAETGSVVIWSGEDDPADTLVPRLRAAGADMNRVHFVDGMQEAGDRYPFDPARDMDALHEAMAHIPDVRMLIIDPLVSAISGDSHKNAEVRRGLQPLADLALKQHCILLGVTHFSKGTAGRDPVERITGSLAFSAQARVVLVAAKQEGDGDRPARRVLMRAKSNIGPDGGGFAYDLQQGELPGYPGVIASSVLWGDTVEGTAREVLAEVEQCNNDQKDEASSFLYELLRHGERPAKDIYKQAEEAGFSRTAMKRAKQRIGVTTAKQGMEGGWVWRLLPEGTMRHAEGATQNYAVPSIPSEKQVLPSEWESPLPDAVDMETVVI